MKFLFIIFLFLKIKAQTDNSAEYFSYEFTNESDYKTTEPATYQNQTTESIHQNFCKELYPYCYCGISSIILQCKNFSSFSQLNFSLLKNQSDQSPRRIYELELEPLKAIPFDQSLNLDGISLFGRAILNKISSFDLYANPFENVNEKNNLNLYLYNVNLETLDYETVCNPNILPNYTSLFSSFGYVLLSEDTYTKSGYLCPLVFKNANLRKMEIYSTNSNPIFNFSSIDYDLNSTITALTIYSAKNLTLDSDFLNPDVFQKLKELNFDFVELESIEENTFKNLTSLRRIFLDLPNFKDFIRKTDNKWMSSLNFYLNPVNYSNPNEISMFENRTLVITFNSRSGQDYSFPNEDLENFKYFPHDKLVYARILADQDLNCSDTLKFVLKNSFSYPSVTFLNTTSTYKCFLTSIEMTTETLFSSTHIQTTSSSDITTSKGQNSTNEPNTDVSLGLYLGTTIPLGAVAILSLISAIYFFFKLKKNRTIGDNNIELF